MSVRWASRLRSPVANVQQVFSRGARRRAPVGDAVNVWLKGPGKAFMEPGKGPNWLGKTVPFPMNPSFKPPPPIADTTKDFIYERYMSNPKRFNVRVLSLAYGISMKRVDAILRLKGLEKSWKEHKTLQTGFQVNMERMLNAQELAMGNVPGQRKDTTDADLQDENEGNDHARDRYQRLFWEPIVENEGQIVPDALAKAKKEAAKSRAQADEAKSDSELLTGRSSSRGVKYKNADTVVYQSDPKRPAIVFKDVGGHFLDVGDRTRRMRNSQRRREVRHSRI